MAGKTGTSEKVALYNAEQAEGNDRGMQYVVSYGATPRQMTAVRLARFLRRAADRGASGGTQAGPIFAAIMEEVLPYLGVDPQYTESEYENLSATAPNVIGMTMAEAKSHLEEQGFSGTVVGDAEDDALVTVQVPSPGASIPKEGMVALYTEEPDPETYVEYRDSSAMTSILAATWRVLPMCRCSLWATAIPATHKVRISQRHQGQARSVIRISFVSSGGVEAAGNTSTNSEE